VNEIQPFSSFLLYLLSILSVIQFPARLSICYQFLVSELAFLGHQFESQQHHTPRSTMPRIDDVQQQLQQAIDELQNQLNAQSDQIQGQLTA